MQLITLCFTFALSLCTFVVVKCQDCSKDSFPRDLERNLDLSKLQDITSGNTLRLTCSIGYVGMSRFQCQTGTWKKQSGRPCERKSCGHPGDTPNGDFQLKDSDDFVFGARVEYSCKKGYQMVSRSTHRICLDQGWDNMIPICEAITCPVIRVNSDVVVIGESEDATFGNVIQFECQSNQKMLVGLSEIDCNHKGEWSGKVPTCEEIKCSAPEIANGRVNGAEQEYKENDLLKYSCFEKYIADGRTPRCTKIGNRAQWTPTPSCEKVKCLLSPIKGTEFTPSGQNVFSPGDDLIIKCQQGQWFFGTKLTEKRVRCNVDGTWSSPPNCEKITCDPPDDSLVQYSSWYGSWRRGDLKVTKDYRCKSGYKPTNGATYAECTNDGTWRPNPLCEEITCDPPQRSVLQYTQRPTKWVTGRFKDQIDYSCKPKFKPTNDATFAECTNDGTWTPNPLCEVEQKIEESCLPPRNGFLVKKDSRSPTFYYSCNEKFKPSTSGWWGVATCTDGKWTEIPTCIDKSPCRGIHDIPNANVS
ncbi:hypothetical protein DPEC_G00337900 [Dallia pectoralis]|uniref:Uncharacterized protein n=1 Tax=Dallia pectoralis TaxID=75939 RepID=A0ACC2F4J3_DALPE|nr:hypothetical protein DPEC_G00337900 [Dallia pectoralis]